MLSCSWACDTFDSTWNILWFLRPVWSAWFKRICSLKSDWSASLAGIAFHGEFGWISETQIDACWCFWCFSVCSSFLFCTCYWSFYPVCLRKAYKIQQPTTHRLQNSKFRGRVARSSGGKCRNADAIKYCTCTWWAVNSIANCHPIANLAEATRASSQAISALSAISSA